MYVHLYPVSYNLAFRNKIAISKKTKQIIRLANSLARRASYVQTSVTLALLILVLINT